MPIITKSDKKKVSKGETLHDDFEDDFSEKVRKLSRDNQQSNNRYQLLPKTGEVSNKGWLGGLLLFFSLIITMIGCKGWSKRGNKF